MKKLISFIVLFTFVVSSFAFAGAPKPTNEPIPVEQEVTPPPPPPPPAQPSAEPLMLKKYGTWGLGFGGNALYGNVEKDELAMYPQTEYGFTWVLGFGISWFSGQPSAQQIRGAAESVKNKYGSNYGTKTLATLIREELGVTSLSYVTLGTAALIVPCNAEIGTMWILGDNMRARIGVGLPTLLSFGINWDF